MSKKGFEVFGVEINPSYIEKINERIVEEDLKVSVVEGRAEELPYENNIFSFANASEITEHVENPEMVCREIYRVLMPNAKAYISFHNRFGVYDYHHHTYFINWMPRTWSERVLKLLGKQKDDGEAGRQKLLTMHYYTYKEVKQLLKSCGFNLIDIRADKISKKYKLFSKILLPIYYIILRPLYFNSFHVLVTKTQVNE